MTSFLVSARLNSFGTHLFVCCAVVVTLRAFSGDSCIQAHHRVNSELPAPPAVGSCCCEVRTESGLKLMNVTNSPVRPWLH